MIGVRLAFVIAALLMTATVAICLPPAWAQNLPSERDPGPPPDLEPGDGPPLEADTPEVADMAGKPMPGQSGLKVPRFASLRSGEVNVRTGPGTRYPVEWQFVKRGLPIEITADDREEYLRHNAGYADSLDGAWDVIIVHDPQPAAMRDLATAHRESRWIWRCHIDSSTADRAAWEFLRPYVEQYDRAVFTLAPFVPVDLRVPVTLISPAIDPLSSKNRALPDYLARETVAELGIDVARPLMIQVSRFDPWKDPLGVVEVWRRARSEFGELQLALVGAMAGDDP